MSVKIECTGLKEAIKRLENIKKAATSEKLKEILTKLAEEGFNVASAGFASALYPGDPTVSMSIVWESENTVTVVAKGESVMFIEFGSGVFYPEHPWQDSYPGVVGHGEYGWRQGANQEGWIYKGERGTGNYALPVYRRTKNGEVQRPDRWRTWGSPPTRAMYDATVQIRDKAEGIIKGVLQI